MSLDQTLQSIRAQGQLLNELILPIPKLLYFTLNLEVYAVHAYQAKFFLDIWNLPIENYGYIATLQATSFFGAVFWANVANRWKKPRAIIAICSIGYAVLMSTFLIPIFKDSLLAHSIYLAIMWGIAQFFLAGCFPILDAMVLVYLARLPQTQSRDLFGRQRLWGTFGHFAATYLSMGFIAMFGYYGMYLLLVLCAVVFCGVLALGLSSVRTLSNALRSPQRAQADSSISPSKRLFSNPNFCFFLLVVLTIGYIRSIMSNFQSYFIEQVLEKSKRFIADAGAVRAITEVGVFFFERLLMDKLGPYWMLIISQLAGVARAFGYGVIPSPPLTTVPGEPMVDIATRYNKMIYGLELLKGLQTGFVVSASVKLANEIAPRDCATSAQGWFSGVFTGLSTAAGGIVGGHLIFYYKQQGHPQPMQQMFKTSAVVPFLMMILFILKYSLIDRVIIWPKSRTASSESSVHHDDNNNSRSHDLETSSMADNNNTPLDMVNSSSSLDLEANPHGASKESMTIEDNKSINVRQWQSKVISGAV
jgi:hypothetical protein